MPSLFHSGYLGYAEPSFFSHHTAKATFIKSIKKLFHPISY